MKSGSRFHVLFFLLAALLALAACSPQAGGATPAASGQFADVEFIGTLESTAPGEWVISGQVVKLSAQTEIAGNLMVGDSVQVRAQVDSNGTVTAAQIRAASQSSAQSQSQSQGSASAAQSWTGVVKSIAPNAWVVSDRTFSVTAQTEIKGNLVVGASVKVEYLVNADGSFTATQIQPEAGLQAGNTFTLQFQHRTGQEFELYGAVESIGPMQWKVAGQSFAIASGTEIKGTIAVGDFVKVHLYDNNGTLTAREIEVAQAEDRTRGAALEFTGTVQSLGAGTLVVDGQTFTLVAATEVKGVILAGDTVKVKAVLSADGTLTAREVKKLGGASSSGSSLSGGPASGGSSSLGSSGSSSSGSDSSSSDDDDDDSGSSSSKSDDNSGSGGSSSKSTP